MKSPLVSQLPDYYWSSYPSYVGKAKPVDWLAQDLTFGMLGNEDKHKGYANYVMAGVDEETTRFYSKGNMASIIGDKGFREWVYEELLPQLAAEQKSRVIQPYLTMGQVISVIANDFAVTEVDITKKVKGPQKENEARKLAMYFCQELVASKLTFDIGLFIFSLYSFPIFYIAGLNPYFLHNKVNVLDFFISHANSGDISLLGRMAIFSPVLPLSPVTLN
jgi:hypothetical protein